MRFLHTRLVSLCVLTLFALLTACMTDDSYSTNSSLHLTPSVDTLHFDTVLTDETSSTKTLWYFNHNREHLRIVSANLEQGANSPFSINIDGLPLTNGTLNTPLRVHAGDSLRLFVRAHPRAQNSDAPQFISDVLHLHLEGGAHLTLPIHGHAQDVITLDSLVIQRDTTLSAARPIRIMRGIAIEAGHTLTLAAGTRLYMHSGANIEVHGRLMAIGTPTQPIEIRGDRTDLMFDKQPYSRIPGQWGGINIKSESFDNQLNFCEITSATTGIACDSSHLNAEKIRIENSVIHNTVNHALSLRHVRAFVGNSQLSNAGANCVNIAGGHYDFIHCTIANFYPFSGTRGVALMATNHTGNTPLPLTHMRFINCIITGFGTDEITGTPSSDNSIAYDYGFHASLLNTKGTEQDQHFTQCVIDNEKQSVSRAKNFAPAFDLDALLFSFALDSLSPARGIADASYTQRYYPTDRIGTPRSNRPAAGCYEPQ